MMLEISGVTKKYYKGAEVFTALENVSIEIRRGDYLVLSGPSGAGKSTLLYVAGGMIRPDSGEVIFEGKSIYDLNKKLKNDYRKKHIGFVFQQFHLMPFLTVEENILLACYEKQHREKISAFLEQCSLIPLRNKYPSELSVGEKQRTAFVRAIITQPDLLLADEPTGNLDPENSSIIMDLMEGFNRSGGTLLLVSHNPDASKYAMKQISLNAGKIVNDHLIP